MYTIFRFVSYILNVSIFVYIYEKSKIIVYNILAFIYILFFQKDLCVCVVLWITYAVDLDFDSVLMKSVPYHSAEDFRFSS